MSQEISCGDLTDKLSDKSPGLITFVRVYFFSRIWNIAWCLVRQLNRLAWIQICSTMIEGERLESTSKYVKSFLCWFGASTFRLSLISFAIMSHISNWTPSIQSQKHYSNESLTIVLITIPSDSISLSVPCLIFIPVHERTILLVFLWLLLRLTVAALRYFFTTFI